MGEIRDKAERELEGLRLRVWHIFYGATLYMLWIHSVYFLARLVGRYLLKDHYVETPDFYYRVGFLLSAGWIFHKFMSEDNF